MRNLTEIFLKRHPTWSNKQANDFIMSHFGVHSRVMNIAEDHIDDNIDSIIQDVILKNNLFEKQVISNLTFPDVNDANSMNRPYYREYVLGSAGCLKLHATLSSDKYLIITLFDINYSYKCPLSKPPRKYLEELKLFLRLLLEELKKPFIFKVSTDLSSVEINKTRCIPSAAQYLMDYNFLENFFLGVNENTALFSVFNEPFNNPNSLLYKFENYFSNKIFRKDNIKQITFNNFFEKITQTNRRQIGYFNIVLYTLITLICDNENIIRIPRENQTQNPVLVSEFVENITDRFRTSEGISVSLKYSRLLSDGKPWYMIFFDGLNYCSDNSKTVSYENDTGYSDSIENIRNRTFEHEIKGTVVTVSSFMKEFNEKLKNPNERLYFYDLMLYFELEQEIKSVSTYEDYCMMIE